jgi:hypothetical protein
MRSAPARLGTGAAEPAARAAVRDATHGHRGRARRRAGAGLRPASAGRGRCPPGRAAGADRRPAGPGRRRAATCDRTVRRTSRLTRASSPVRSVRRLPGISSTRRPPGGAARPAGTSRVLPPTPPGRSGHATPTR